MVENGDGFLTNCRRHLLNFRNRISKERNFCVTKEKDYWG